jgi:UDP-N-acetylglucosamine 2-epimerase (non-hydrolysing)
VPCLTLPNNTERPITLEQGTSTLVGFDPERIVAAAQRALGGSREAPPVPEFWGGRAASRIVDILTA